MQRETESDRLDRGVFPAQHLAFADRTSHANDTLCIDQSELLVALAESAAFSQVDIHLTYPGKSCRIVHVLEAVAPILKVQGHSTVYPGVFGRCTPRCSSYRAWRALSSSLWGPRLSSGRGICLASSIRRTNDSGTVYAGAAADSV